VPFPRGAARAAAAARASARLADRRDVLRLGPFRALGCLVLDLRAFRERLVAVTGDRRMMDEQILLAVVRADEAVALRVVEPLHGSCSHEKNTSSYLSRTVDGRRQPTRYTLCEAPTLTEVGARPGYGSAMCEIARFAAMLCGPFSAIEWG